MCICVCVCVRIMCMYVHKLHLAVSQPDARNTRHFSSGIIFTKRRSLARQSPTLVQNYIYIYTRACNAFSTRSFCGFQRSVHARSSHQLEIRDLKNRAIDHPPLSFTAFLRQPAGEKSRGIFKFRRSPSFCLPPRFSRTPIHLFYTLLLRAEFVLVRWKIRMAHDQPIITKIFFRVKVEKAIWLWLVMIVDCNWLCSSLIWFLESGINDKNLFALKFDRMMWLYRGLK